MQTALETTLGSAEKAEEALAWAKEFSFRTPYELYEINSALVRLQAYGLDAQEWMQTLGDTAAALGKPIMQAVEAIADAQTGEFERLKEFGMKVIKEGGQDLLMYTDKLGQEQRAIIDRNNREMVANTIKTIWNERYAGGMEKLSENWNATMSNLRTAWAETRDALFDEAWFEWVTEQMKKLASALSDFAINLKRMRSEAGMSADEAQKAGENWEKYLGQIRDADPVFKSLHRSHMGMRKEFENSEGYTEAIRKSGKSYAEWYKEEFGMAPQKYRDVVNELEEAFPGYEAALNKYEQATERYIENTKEMNTKLKVEEITPKPPPVVTKTDKKKKEKEDTTYIDLMTRLEERITDQRIRAVKDGRARIEAEWEKEREGIRNNEKLKAGERDAALEKLKEYYTNELKAYDNFLIEKNEKDKQAIISEDLRMMRTQYVESLILWKQNEFTIWQESYDRLQELQQMWTENTLTEEQRLLMSEEDWAKSRIGIYNRVAEAASDTANATAQIARGSLAIMGMNERDRAKILSPLEWALGFKDAAMAATYLAEGDLAKAAAYTASAGSHFDAARRFEKIAKSSGDKGGGARGGGAGGGAGAPTEEEEGYVARTAAVTVNAAHLVEQMQGLAVMGNMDDVTRGLLRLIRESAQYDDVSVDLTGLDIT